MSARAILLAAAVAAAGTAASAEVVLEGVHWQVARVEQGRVAAWQDVKVLQDGPPKLDNRLRARLVLKNRGDKPEEGLLIRYAMTARLDGPADGPGAAGVWAIPFDVEERRVPKVAAGKMIEVPLDVNAALDLYLRRLARTGWWPDRVRLQAMVDPHQGGANLQTVEDVIEVQKELKP